MTGSHELIRALRMPPTGFELISRNGRAITTIDEWRNELDKREQMKFVPGYSAYETARAWTEPNRVPIDEGRSREAELAPD